ncbi:DUF6059 family protein [Streptomyces sp. NPDC086080]|uniref:DUF6059 family protein n=1 Tax=Streptomyces sp. NPDC086080 TaxID=3365748 RepID=UPI0037CF6E07
MRKSPTWLRRAGRHLMAGLVGLGQSLGAYTTIESYGLVPASQPGQVPVAGRTEGGSTEGASTENAGDVPPPGHPERLVPVSELSGSDRRAWRRLEESWESVTTGTDRPDGSATLGSRRSAGIRRSRSRRWMPPPRRG